MGRKTPFIIVALVMAMSGWTALAEDKGTDTDASTAEVESGHTAVDNGTDARGDFVQHRVDQVSSFAEALANMYPDNRVDQVSSFAEALANMYPDNRVDAVSSFAEVLANMNLDLEKSCLSSTSLSPPAAQKHAENWQKLVDSGADIDVSDITFQVFLATMDSSTRDVQCFPRNCPWSHEEIDWDDGDDRLAYVRWMANASTEDLKACLSGTEITPLAAQTHAENWLVAAE